MSEDGMPYQAADIRSHAGPLAGPSPGPDPGPEPGPGPGPGPAPGPEGDGGRAEPMGLMKHWQAYCGNGHGWLAEWRFEWAMAVADSADHWLDNPQCASKTEVREHGSW